MAEPARKLPTTPRRLDPEIAAREYCRDAVARAEGSWLELRDILPARRWFIVAHDSFIDADGDPFDERAKAFRVVACLDATRIEHINKYGACDERLDIALAKFLPVFEAFTVLADNRLMKGRY